MATAASTSAAAVAAASRLLVRRAPPRLLRRLPRAALAASRPSPPSSSSYGAVAVALGRQPLGHRARMGHTAAAAAAGPALGLTKPNAVEPPQVRVRDGVRVQFQVQSLAWCLGLLQIPELPICVVK